MIGRTLGRYKIVEHLGSGGEGSVWKAEHMLLKEPRALKFLSEALGAQPAARRRFLNAARAVCRLSHPHIAAAHDADEIDGQVFIAYDFVEGESLAKRIARGPLPIAEAVRLAREAAEGLAHAHSRGVLHRDISSANLMVTREGQLKIVDFGLARVEGLSRTTTSDVLKGTAGYISPELVRNQHWDERSDLYALGVVLYQALTGRLPFEGGLESQLYQKLNDDPEPPSQRRAEVPDPLEKVTLQLLEREPQDRTPSAEALADELSALEGSGELPGLESHRAGLAGSNAPSAGRRATTSAGAKRWLRRRWRALTHRRNRGRVGVALLALAASAAMLLWRPWQSALPDVRAIAVLPFTNESADPEESAHFVNIGGSIVSKLGQLSGIQVLPWETSRRAVPDASRNLRDIGRALRVDALVTGTFRELDGQIGIRVSFVDARNGFQLWAGEFNESVSNVFDVEYKVALGVAARIKGQLTASEEHRIEEPVAANADAYEYYLLGSDAYLAGDRASADHALAMYERAVELAPRFAEAHAGIGALLHDRSYRGWTEGDTELFEAEKRFERALEIKPDLWAARRGLIRVYMETGRREDCLRIGVEAAKDESEDIEALHTLGEALLYGGLPELAIPVFERTVEIAPAYRAVYYSHAVAFLMSWDYRKVIDVSERNTLQFGADPEVLILLGFAYSVIDSLETARAYFDRANTLYGDSPNYHIYFFEGHNWRKLGEMERARQVWSEGLRRLDSKLAGNPSNARLRVIRVNLLASLGDEEAFYREVRRMELEGIAFGPNLAAAYLYLGDVDGARMVARLPQAGIPHLRRFDFPGFFGIEAITSDPRIAQIFEMLEGDKGKLRALWEAGIEESRP